MNDKNHAVGMKVLGRSEEKSGENSSNSGHEKGGKKMALKNLERSHGFGTTVESLFTYHKLKDQSRVVSRDYIDQHNRRLRDRFRQVDSKIQRQD